MKFWRTSGVLAFALVLLSAAACTQNKPAVPTPTLVLINQTPVLPVSVTETPSAQETALAPAGTEVAPVEGTPATEEPTLFPTPTAGFPTVPPPPEATTAPSTENASPSTSACPNPYTVQRGDWLYQIARKCGISPQALIAANPGLNPNYVIPGQVLQIPGGGTSGGAPPPPTGGTGGQIYVVQPGDNLFRIALRFGTTVQAIMAANGLGSTSIYVGQRLRIP